jgi:hypothetical protein
VRWSAAQPVVDGARRDHGDRQAEAGITQAVAGRAQQAGLGADQLQALQQAGLHTARDPVGDGPPGVHRGHHLGDPDHTMPADVADQLQVAISTPVRSPGPPPRRFRSRYPSITKTKRTPFSPPGLRLSASAPHPVPGLLCTAPPAVRPHATLLGHYQDFGRRPRPLTTHLVFTW